jgi:excisionase family DNA binding protein
VIFGDRFYSVAELADVTGYHPDSIYRAIASGALAAAKPGGKWLIAGAAINGWLQAAQPGDRGGDYSEDYSRSARPSVARSGKPARRASSGARGSLRDRARQSRAA